MSEFSKHEESLLRLAARVSSHARSMFWFWVGGIGLGTAVLLLLIGDPASRENWAFGLCVIAVFGQALGYVRFRDRALCLINKLSANQTS